MAPRPNDLHENATSKTNTFHVQSQPVEGTDDKNKSPRRPRWTRQETLILIEGKKFAENRGRKGCRSSSIFRTDQLKPKWDAVSSLCWQHGVNRGPVQCRKRWESQVKQESESFWMMRNDLRKENKQPTFFDKEIYDFLDGKSYTAAAYQLAGVTIRTNLKDNDQLEVFKAQDEGEWSILRFRTVCTQGRCQEPRKGTASNREFNDENPSSISNFRYSKRKTTRLTIPEGTCFSEGLKRRRMSLEGCQDYCLEHQLIKVLERNNKALDAQLESQSMNSQLDREQRKDHNDSLFAALSKIGEALAEIADNLGVHFIV